MNEIIYRLDKILEAMNKLVELRSADLGASSSVVEFNQKNFLEAIDIIHTWCIVCKGHTKNNTAKGEEHRCIVCNATKPIY